MAAAGLTSTEDFNLALTYGNCVGGATVHYWADSYRTPADRLIRWQREFGLEDYTPETLTPYFEKLEKDLSVHPAGEAFFNGCNQLFRKGVKALGWHAKPVPQARKGCLKSGYCMQGCAYNAKQSMLVTYIPQAVHAGAKVYADCEVIEISVEKGRAVGVVARVIDRDSQKPSGAHLHVKAPVIVIAAGGYGSAPLLMRSKLANSSGQLGKNLHTNPNAMVFGRFEEEVVMWRNIPAAYGCDEWRLARFEKGQYQAGGYLLMPNQLGPAVLSVMLPGFGDSHRRRMEAMPHLASTTAWIDDVETGSVTLDRLGQPRYHYPVTGYNALELRDAMKKGAQVLFAAGAKEVFLADSLGTVLADESQLKRVDQVEIGPGSIGFAAPHPAGMCRMGVNPEASVVDLRGEIHDLKGLFVADASILPTGVSVDPSLTIGAFALRIADGILNRELS